MTTRELNTHRPLKAIFVADWVEAVFIHYAVEPEVLQPYIPFELDVFEGKAYISLVAFTQRRLRPTFGGRLTEALSKPLACHEFLNVRTYVRTGGERGIYFIAEWIPNRLAALIGPPMYGLPYRVGRLRYKHDLPHGELHGAVQAPGGAIEFDGTVDDSIKPEPAKPGTLDAFLVERYTAWTHRNGVSRRFRIRHAPWDIVPAEIILPRFDLIAQSTGGILVNANPVAAHYSEGTFGVRIGRPERSRT